MVYKSQVYKTTNLFNIISVIACEANMQVKIALTLITLLIFTCLTINPAQAATSNAWETKASMHVARSSLGAAVVNGEIYAIGGVIDPPSYVTCTGANEKYDPTSNQWTTKTSMPTPRASFATAVVEDRIYCIGGTTGLNEGQVIVTGVNEVYDPATDTWTSKTDMPTPRVGLTAAVFENKIYVFGGNSNVTEVYDPATDTWTTKASMPVKPGLRMIWSCTSAVVNGKVHVFGAFPYSASNQVYDPTSDSWSFEAPIVQGYLLAAAVSIGSAEGILVFGVDSTWWDAGPPNFTSLTWASSQDCWRVTSLMPTPRVNFALAAIGDTVYVIGGSIVMIENNAHPTTILEKYTPQKDKPTDTHPPEIIVLSPQDKTYSTAVSVDFAVNEPTCEVLLSVDEQSPTSISGNTSLTVKQGNHNITIYAIDYSGNIGASNIVSFNVSEKGTVPLFWLVLIGVGVTVFLVGAALIWVYFVKRKT
ncbi:MAG: Kelch repeat-containing protein [Candidatus Bathyarchaeia archaeon]